MSSPLDDSLRSTSARSLAFATPELLRAVARRRAAFADASDPRAQLAAVLDDAVEMEVLAERDVQRIAAYLDQGDDAAAIARQYYGEALADREASPLVAILFAVAATIGPPHPAAPRARLTEADIACFISAAMVMDPAMSTGILVGGVAWR